MSEQTQQAMRALTAAILAGGMVLIFGPVL